jgi:hypothetical protein
MASSITEAIPGTADLLGPIAGPLAMTRQLLDPVPHRYNLLLSNIHSYVFGGREH